MCSSDLVFVIVLIIIILLLVLLLANMKMNILEKSFFSISDEFLYFSSFFHFIYLLSPLNTYFWQILVFSFYISSSIFILSLNLTLILFFVSPFHSLSLLVFIFVILLLCLSLLVCITVSHFMILIDLIWFIV